MGGPDVTGYFSDRVDHYAKFRPSYPRAAVQFLLAGLAPPVRAVDVGAGTGIMTRLLQAEGAEVVGVEPNDAMRAEAERQPAPGLSYRAGTAEALGLPDGAADLVTCAQAFHWFDAPRALREFRRALRPGGRVALVWNVRQERTPFGRVYEQVVRAAQADARARGRVVGGEHRADPTQGGWFRDARLGTFENEVPMAWDELVGRALSASYFPPPGPLRADLLARLRAAFEAEAQEGRVVFHHATEVTLAERA